MQANPLVSTEVSISTIPTDSKPIALPLSLILRIIHHPHLKSLQTIVYFDDEFDSEEEMPDDSDDDGYNEYGEYDGFI